MKTLLLMWNQLNIIEKNNYILEVFASNIFKGGNFFLNSI